MGICRGIMVLVLRGTEIACSIKGRHHHLPNLPLAAAAAAGITDVGIGATGARDDGRGPAAAPPAAAGGLAGGVGRPECFDVPPCKA